MRSKKFLSALAFIVAFGLSAAFAGLFIVDRQIETLNLAVNDPELGYAVPYESKATNCFTRRNKSANAGKITAFINQDKRNGRESGNVRYEGDENIFALPDASAVGDYASAVEDYVAASSTMKTSDLPADFQSEWREHMKAWRDYSEFLDRMKKSSNRAVLTVEELVEVDNFHSREIERTWNAVLRNGADYGADVY